MVRSTCIPIPTACFLYISFCVPNTRDVTPSEASLGLLALPHWLGVYHCSSGLRLQLLLLPLTVGGNKMMCMHHDAADALAPYSTMIDIAISLSPFPGPCLPHPEAQLHNMCGSPELSSIDTWSLTSVRATAHPLLKGACQSLLIEEEGIPTARVSILQYQIIH